MRVEIRPSNARGSLVAPPSKSMAHRLLLCAGLGAGESIVRHLAFSEDVTATINCLRALGADVRLDGDCAYVHGTDVRGMTGKTIDLYCNECGSTLRFFTPLCMLSGEERVLYGSRRLLSRPMSVYEEIAQKQEIVFIPSPDRLTVKGVLQSGVYEIVGNISSQFISGLLFALPLLDGDSEIHILPPVESKPYIDMTAAALREFGVHIGVSFFDDGPQALHDGSLGKGSLCPQRSQPIVYRIKGGQRYLPQDVTVEGDYSNAAFFEALNIVGGEVRIEGLREDTLQGDSVYKILFENIKNGIEPIDIADCPDLGPILFAAAALCGGCRFTGTRRLRIKESDRAEAMRRELEKCGVRLTAGENEVVVHPDKLCAPQKPLCGHNDHRIVMALSVLLTRVGGVIEGAEAVNKSFPDFFERLQDLGVDLSYGMDQ